MSRLGSDGRIAVYRDDDHCERSPGIVRDFGRRSSEIIVTEHRVRVIGSKDHHVWTPRADARSKVLVGGPHVGKGHALTFRNLTVRVCHGHAAGTGVGVLALHPEL